MSEETSFVPDIGLAKALFSTGSNSTNSFSAANTGSRSVQGATNMRYGTVQEDTTGNGKVKIILDGSTDPIEVDCSETFKAGDRVCVLYFAGSYKAFSLMGNTIGGNMVVFDGIFADKIIANQAFIHKLTANEAFINSLTANEAFIEKLTAQEAFIQELIANNAFIETLVSNKAFIDDLEAKYVTVGKTNIDQAWINDLFVKSSFVAQDGTIFNLTGLHIDANDITSGTLTVDRLVVQGSDGEYYLLEPKGDGEFDQTKLDGNIIKQNSIHADRIIANSITTDQITTNNLVGTGGWINLANGTFAYGNPKMDENGKYLGNFITWDGTKLKLNVDELSIDSTSFNDELEVLRTSIKQTADKVEISATQASNAQTTANSANTTINNLLTTNFIFDASGLTIKATNGAYYTKIAANGFNILRTSDDKGFVLSLDGSGTSSIAYFRTTDRNMNMKMMKEGAEAALVLDTQSVGISRPNTSILRDECSGVPAGRFQGWHLVWNGNSSGSISWSTRGYTIPSNVTKMAIIYCNSDQNSQGCSFEIYDFMYGNGWVTLSSIYHRTNTGIACEGKKMMVSTQGLTYHNSARLYSNFGTDYVMSNGTSSFINILAVYILL